MIKNTILNLANKMYEIAKKVSNFLMKHSKRISNGRIWKIISTYFILPLIVGVSVIAYVINLSESE